MSITTEDLTTLTAEELRRRLTLAEQKIESLRTDIPIQAMASARSSGVSLGPVEDKLEALGLTMPATEVEFYVDIRVRVRGQVTNPNEVSPSWISSSMTLDEASVEEAFEMDDDWEDVEVAVVDHDIDDDSIEKRVP